ncbi:MAG TPA: YXWGXW repeat-containing protein [Bacteroidia bacterium]|jgi:hypothetical protein|nr:YXWGXW repeat-containing protein [Bacteroidia bacterium]
MKKIAVIIITIFSLLGAITKTNAQVGVGISVGVAPPALPVYEQPPCPQEGFLWTPGYWYWGANGYFWVPGVWCRPARVGFLWTPGYWGFEGGHYWWHGGYWGPHVGYYGGVCYGFGYGGHGFYGGRWEGGAFRYNSAVCHVGPGFHNTYVDRTVIHNTTVNRSSFNGPGGINERPNAEEQSAMHEQHVNATSEQQNHEQKAGNNRNQLASVNHGSPATTARSTIGGQKFNSAGHAMQAAHPANATHANAANASHMNANPQAHHNAMQNRGGGQQRGNFQHSSPRQAQPAKAQGGGRNMGGGGRGRNR